MKVREVTAATVEDPDNLKKFVHRIEKVDEGDHNESDGTDSEYETGEDDDEEEEEEEAAPVMAGEKARRFSELSPESDEETRPTTQRRRTEELDVVEVTPEERKVKQAVSKAPRKPIRMMVGREKFDFVGAFREAPVTGLKKGSFFD